MRSKNIGEKITLSGEGLTIEDLVMVSRDPEVKVEISQNAQKNVQESYKLVQKIVKEKNPTYGINTGFGSFKNVSIPERGTIELQRNLIRSHACGVGNPFAKDVVRAAIVLRLNSFLKGFSGVRLEMLQSLLSILNNDVYPHVPEQGSVGSSGDLAPLSHLGLVLLGEGECLVDGVRVPSAQVFKKMGINFFELNAKEGLALTNGTTFQTAVAALAVHDSEILIATADCAAALSVEVLMGSKKAFYSEIHQARNQTGQIQSAKNIFSIIKNSPIIQSHEDCDRVQDSYSLRCTPQVHGAVRDAFQYVKKVVENEINAATDNPLIFPDNETVLSGGNFHGEPIAIAMDTLGIALSEVANISERRTAKMIDKNNSEGLPAYLIDPKKGGTHSGLMIPQYTAASLVSENKVLAHPASVDSIPTSANQEDHVSMGTIAARKAFQIMKNVANVLAIEFLNNSQAYEFRKPVKLSNVTGAIYLLIRENVPPVNVDRPFYLDIENINRLILDRKIIEIAEHFIPDWNN